MLEKEGSCAGETSDMYRHYAERCAPHGELCVREGAGGCSHKVGPSITTTLSMYTTSSPACSRRLSAFVSIHSSISVLFRATTLVCPAMATDDVSRMAYTVAANTRGYCLLLSYET
jgi:hypothetical protein